MAFDGTILLPASVAGTAFWYLIFSTIVFFCYAHTFIYISSLTQTWFLPTHSVTNRHFQPVLTIFILYSGCSA